MHSTSGEFSFKSGTVAKKKKKKRKKKGNCCRTFAQAGGLTKLRKHYFPHPFIFDDSIKVVGQQRIWRSVGRGGGDKRTLLRFCICSVNIFNEPNA